jgi:hypothetical protein
MPFEELSITPSSKNIQLNISKTISFSSSSPKSKSWFSKKVVPAIRRVGNVAGNVASVAGKVATVASIL